ARSVGRAAAGLGPVPERPGRPARQPEPTRGRPADGPALGRDPRVRGARRNGDPAAGRRSLPRRAGPRGRRLMTRVPVWNEHRQERTDAPVRAVYPDGIHGAIAEGLRAAGFDVRTAMLDEPQHGLTEAVLAETDVLTWWGHVAHDAVDDAVVDRVRSR